MKISIQGQDYTAALDGAHALTIERKLNEPSICQLWLGMPSGGNLGAPLRYQSLRVTGDDGTVYFTGYIAASPMPEYCGLGMEGPRYRTAIQAVSDEILLDQLPMPPRGGAVGGTVAAALTSLVTHSGSTILSTQGLELTTPVSCVTPEPGSNWSSRAGQVANMARASYRAINGALIAAPVQTTVHPLNETDGSLQLANLSLTAGVQRALANDVTVCGEDEPVAYVTEYFLGDGVATQFMLAAEPYFPPTSQVTILHELFNEPVIDKTLWSVVGGSGYLALGAGGLSMNGGNGVDGQTLITWLDPVEMGGTLLLEATGVTLSPGSTGILAGLFLAMETAASCTAGFQATAQSGTGAVTLQPIIQGTPAGTTFPLAPTNQYTLRIRIHCPECERSQAIYYSLGDNGMVSAGGAAVLAPGRIQMEIQQFVNGVGASPVTLYDGALADLPGTCMAVPASSVNLIGAMRSFSIRNLGSGWVTSTAPGSSAYTRRVGTTAEAAECYTDRSGKLVFYTGYIPVAGEQIAVSYRTKGRAVGRAVNAASQTAMAQIGWPASAIWIGSVTSPAARSSADCRSAAGVMAEAAASTSALWTGTYKGNGINFSSDVWPGDALQLIAPSTNLDTEVVVRTVKVSYRASYPDLVEYSIAFANDWADDLAIKTSKTVPANTWLPAAVEPTVLANLNGLTVTSLNGNTVTLNTGLAAPAGGGFEVRLRDFAFMPGNDSTLVLRSSQSNFSFSRVSPSDRFYIRMYDGATPPNYSEFSVALFINLPLSA